MSARTPGPWTTSPCSNGGRLVHRGDPLDRHKHVQTIQVLPEADAYLIAAAPELHEALLEAIAIIEGRPRRSPYVAVDHWRAVIARAEGRP
jgi:hypothetical protein